MVGKQRIFIRDVETFEAVTWLFTRDGQKTIKYVASRSGKMAFDFRNIYDHSKLNGADLQKIAAAHRQMVFGKGEFLLRQGQMANEYYCLESGLIRSYAISNEGNEITTGFFGKDDIVIEVASIFLRTQTRENIQALTECVCWKIMFEDFQQLFNTIEGFSEWGRKWMSNALFHSKQRALSMITDSAMARYLTLQQEYPEILHHVPLKYIASYLGVTDSTLSRIRREVKRYQ